MIISYCMIRGLPSSTTYLMLGDLRCFESIISILLKNPGFGYWMLFLEICGLIGLGGASGLGLKNFTIDFLKNDYNSYLEKCIFIMDFLENDDVIIMGFSANQVSFFFCIPLVFFGLFVLFGRTNFTLLGLLFVSGFLFSSASNNLWEFSILFIKGESILIFSLILLTGMRYLKSENANVSFKFVSGTMVILSKTFFF